MTTIRGDLTVEGTEEFLAPSQSFEAIKRHKLRGMHGEYQLPLVILLCVLARPTIARGPTFLEWHEVQTLFHEMGHAMHCRSISPHIYHE